MGKEQAAPALVPLLQSAHARLAGSEVRPPPVVSFYPYVSTKSTIRVRDGRLHVRVSDHLRDAPDAALRGLFSILLCRLRRWPESRADPGDLAAYRTAIQGTEGRRSESRRSRGRKHVDPIGDHRSLLESFLRVSLETGLVVPDPPVLSWSRTRSRRRFGHQDTDHGCIVISRVLDDPKVPEFVLDYVVYHELLHIVHPPVQGSGGKRIIHHKRFRDAEKRFPQRDEAEKWLTRLASAPRRP